MNKSIKCSFAACLLGFGVPAPVQAQGPIRATLVIQADLQPYLGTLVDPEDDEDEALDPNGYQVVTRPAMVHPFRFTFENYKATENDLSDRSLRIRRPIELNLQFPGGANGQGRTERVSFGSRSKTANFFHIMMKYEICRRQQEAAGSWFWSFCGYPERVIQEAWKPIRSLNCYSFVHYTHTSDTQGFFSQFDPGAWEEIPVEAIRFGDLARLTPFNGIAGEHYMMYVGEGLYLAKLGYTDDFAITDLNNAARLYQVDEGEGYAIAAFAPR